MAGEAKGVPVGLVDPVPADVHVATRTATASHATVVRRMARLSTQVRLLDHHSMPAASPSATIFATASSSVRRRPWAYATAHVSGSRFCRVISNGS